MHVSIIVPARNAAPTIERTVRSVLAQTHAKWELLIVDNGSTDDTHAVACRLAAGDVRIRVLSEPRAGVCRARNHGLREAWFPWVLFLDADDTLAETALQELTEVLARDPKLDAVHGHWDRLGPDGEAVEVARQPLVGDLFSALAMTCVFSIHSCVVRRQSLLDVGCFDESLVTCEDWDLWQRIARAGARFGYVASVVAHYHMRQGSASTQGRQLARDGVVVVRRGHAADPRVRHPVARWKNGKDPQGADEAVFFLLSWAAGLVIGSGDDATSLLELVADVRAPDLDPGVIPECVLPAVLLPQCCKPADWPRLWPEVQPRLRRFSGALARHNEIPSFASRVMLAAQRYISIQLLEQGGGAVVGEMASLQLETTEPIRDLVLPASVNRVHCRLTCEGAEVGVLELPVFDGRIPAFVLEDAVAHRAFWGLLEHFFRRHRYPQLRIERAGGKYSAWHRDVCLIPSMELHRDFFWESLHNWLGRLCVLQDLWECPSATLASIEEGLLPGDATARELCCSDYRVTIDVTAEPVTLVTELPELMVLATLGGRALCHFTLPVLGGRVGWDVLRARIVSTAGMEICIACARDALVGRPLDAEPRSLRARLLERSDRAVGDAGWLPDYARAWFLGGEAAEHVPQPAVTFIPRRSGESSPRRAWLPASAREHLRALAGLTGESLVVPAGADAGDARAVAYLPEIQPGARTNPANGEGLREQLDPLLRSTPDPRDDQLAPLDSAVRARVGAPDAAPARAPQHRTQKAYSLPILMYHRVAPSGAETTQRWRVTPRMFEQQLAALKRLGFYSVTFAQWNDAASRRRPLPGRPVMLTFDDGYLDFYEHAWPLLQQYGFGATVFIVAERVGGTNVWDAMYGEKLPLMDWSQIRGLHAEGVEFGSHSASHRFLTTLSPGQLVDDLTRSRVMLMKELGRCDSLAYPYGDRDDIVEHIAGACGYRFAVTTDEGRARFENGPLGLPRIEIAGDETIEQFRSRFVLPIQRRALHRLRRSRAYAWARLKVPERIRVAGKRWVLERSP